MYYYTRLHVMSSSPNTTKTFVLSYLLTFKGKKSEIRTNLMNLLGLSRMGLYKVLQELERDDLINSDFEAINLPENFNIPYINIRDDYIEKYGLKTAIYLTWLEKRKRSERMSDVQAGRETTLSQRTIYRCKAKLRKEGKVKEKRGYENVFTKEKFDIKKMGEEIRKVHIGKIKAKSNGRSAMSTTYMQACSDAGYKTPPPTRKDVAVACGIQKSFDMHDYDVPVIDIIKYMVEHWASLRSMKNKPDAPSLGLLPIFYKEICEYIKNPGVEIVKVKI